MTDVSDLSSTEWATTVSCTGTKTTVRVLEIVVTYTEGGSSDPILTLNPTSWDFGNVPVSEDASKEFSVSGLNLVAGDLTINVPEGFSVSPSSISVSEATLAATVVTVSKNTSTIAEYSGDLSISGCGLAEAKKASIKMNVVEDPAPTGTFELFTGDLVEGDYVFVVSDIAMTNSISSSRLVNTPVKITDDAINNPDASIIWHVAASDDYWTIYNAAVEKFAASTGGANKAQMLADGTDDKAKWSVVKNGNAFNFENKANAAGEVNARLSRNGDYGWACYKDYSNIDLYKKADGGSITPDPDPIAEIGGKFIINAKGDTAIFSNGNLQYQQSSNTWRCAPNQYDWAGEAANEQMGNPAYEGWVDLFCWSLGAENNYGATSNNLSTNYHNKDFVDWGGLFSGEWSTLSSAQWSYLLNSRSGANDKWGMAMIEDNLGMILLPNEWTAPAGVTFVPRTNPTSELWDDGDMIDASYDHFRVKPENMPANKFTLAEWEELEAAGAIFLPYAGRRSGGYGNHINKDDEEVAAEYNYTYYENYLGTYWTSTAATKEKGTVNYVYTFKYEGGDYNWGKAVIWSENGRYGQSVRLVHIIPRQYTVTYDINGADGEVPVDAKTYLDGEEITLADASGLSKEGYVFAGWKFKGETYNGTYTVDNVLADEEIVFEAQWELDWQVVRDGLNADEYHTICLDKAVTHVRGASIWRVLSKNDGNLHPDIVLEEVWLPLVAGRPYIFFTTADKLEVVYSGDAVLAPVNDNDNNGLIGSFVQAPIENNPSYYVIYENELYFVDSDDIKVEANEAYLDMTIVPELSEAAPLPGHPQVLMKTHASGVPTAIEGQNASDKPIKLMMNGQLYILRGDKVYDVTGSQVK